MGGGTGDGFVNERYEELLEVKDNVYMGMGNCIIVTELDFNSNKHIRRSVIHKDRGLLGLLHEDVMGTKEIHRVF